MTRIVIRAIISTVKGGRRNEKLFLAGNYQDASGRWLVRSELRWGPSSIQASHKERAGNGNPPEKGYPGGNSKKHREAVRGKIPLTGFRFPSSLYRKENRQ